MSEKKSRYDAEGYWLAKGLFSEAEADDICHHYMEMRKEGPKPADMGGDPNDPDDPLNAFPRFINMHDWDERTVGWHEDRRLRDTASELIGQPVRLCQTMLYFKPAGGRGQAIHQDNQYITEAPLIGVWMALDRCDNDNGCMYVIPKSHKSGLYNVEPADTKASFTGGASVVPDSGEDRYYVHMEKGDVLFFNGFTLHGSEPNVTADRFRRSFIVHYFGEKTTPIDALHEQTMGSVG